MDPKFRENIRLSAGLTSNSSQLTPPAKVPSSPTCSSPERGGEQENSLYEAGLYGKQFRAGVVEWGGAQYGEQTGYQPPARHQDRFSYSAPYNQVITSYLSLTTLTALVFQGGSDVREQRQVPGESHSRQE